jgi:hypothetical protein
MAFPRYLGGATEPVGGLGASLSAFATYPQRGKCIVRRAPFNARRPNSGRAQCL